MQQDTKTPGSAAGRIAATMTPGHSRSAAPPTGGRVAAPAGQPPRPPAQVAPGPIDHTATTSAPRRAPPSTNAHQEQPQLEEFVQKLLRPLINAWLDGHMPVYIAEALRREQAARQRKAGT